VKSSLHPLYNLLSNGAAASDRDLASCSSSYGQASMCDADAIQTMRF